jgi:hypothetical protein
MLQIWAFLVACVPIFVACVFSWVVTISLPISIFSAGQDSHSCSARAKSFLFLFPQAGLWIFRPASLLCDLVFVSVFLLWYACLERAYSLLADSSMCERSVPARLAQRFRVDQR